MGTREVAEYSEIHLQENEKWEKDISFIPGEIGDGQNIDYLLFNDSENELEHSLYLFIDVLEKWPVIYFRFDSELK